MEMSKQYGEGKQQPSTLKPVTGSLIRRGKTLPDVRSSFTFYSKLSDHLTNPEVYKLGF